MTRHSRNKPDGRFRIFAAVVMILAAVSAAVAGLVYAFSTLRDLWHEQCRIEDPELDVTVTSGKMIHPDVVTMHFGLTNGANLAEIDYEGLRARLLDRVPNIRDLRIERRLPNRVNVEVIEREAIARIATARNPSEIGRVADLDGVVFRFVNNVSSLPLVRESSSVPTPPGKRLSGADAAALRLVDTASSPDFADLRILEVDASYPDFLLATLGDYSTARIAWEDMLSVSQTSTASLRRQLRRLLHAVKSNVSRSTRMWIATDWGVPGRVYASDPAFSATPSSQNERNRP